MKKLMATIFGLTLAIGSVSAFAQESKPADTKKADTTTAPKTKSTKKHHNNKKKTSTEAAPAADATKK
jgi:hypothetical protein